MPSLQHTQYDYARLAVMTYPSVCTWVKQAIKDLEARDPVDAAGDAQLVADLMNSRCTEILNRGREAGERHG